MLVRDHALRGRGAADHTPRCLLVVIDLRRVGGRTVADEFEVAPHSQYHAQPAQGVQRQRESDDKAVQMVVSSDKGGAGEQRYQALYQARDIREREHRAAVSFKVLERL